MASTSVRSFFIIIALTVSFVFIFLYIKKKRKNNERDWLDWENIHRFCSENHQYNILIVTSIRQHAKTGTKGYAKWVGTENTSAFWISDAWPKTGTIFVCTGRIGHGPHHQEEVFYINDIKYRLPGSILTGKERYIRKQKKASKHIHKGVVDAESGK